MNEVELIRAQLAAERRHAAEVANACASALEAAAVHAAASGSALVEFCQACVDYLVWILTRFEQRDQVLSDLFHSRLAIDNEARRTLDELLKRPGKSRDALAKLEEALSCASGRATAAASDKRWHEFTEFFNGVWSARRAALDRLFERYARVADWRAVCAIDADSILEERGRYANVRGKLPAGIELRAADASST